MTPYLSKKRSGAHRSIILPSLMLFVAMLLPGLVHHATGVETGGRKVYGRIRGTILDAVGEPIGGLLVQLSSRDESGLLRITGTDDGGAYSFHDLPAGTYDIEVHADGYREGRKGGISVRPPFQNIVGFTLERASGVPVPSIAAGGSPEDVPYDGDPVTVQGQFVDQERNTVPEVSVTLLEAGTGRAYQSFSTLMGDFSIEEVPPGRYRILVTSPGHVTLEIPSVRVMPNSGLNLSLTLVEYSLNLRDRERSTLPSEKPRALGEEVSVALAAAVGTTAQDDAAESDDDEGAPGEGETEPESTAGENDDGGDRPVGPDDEESSGGTEGV